MAGGELRRFETPRDQPRTDEVATPAVPERESEPPWSREYESVIDLVADRLSSRDTHAVERARPDDARDFHRLGDDEVREFVDRPPWAEMLDDAERSAVNRYKYLDGYTINHGLRDGKTTPADQELIQSLDSAIAKGRIDRDVLLFRGTNLEGLDELEEGDVLSDAGYVSTSAQEHVASGEVFCQPNQPGSVLFEIEVPRGTRAAFPETLAAFGESEVLLPRASRFRVVSISSDEDIGRRIRVRLEAHDQS